MLDFLQISTRSPKRGVTEIYPRFIVQKSTDLMIKGHSFYAIWVEERKQWSTDEFEAIRIIDSELYGYFEQHKNEFDGNVKVAYLKDSENRMIDMWIKYCQKQQPDHYHQLDEKLIFSNSKAGKREYSSKSLNYPLEAGKHDAWDRLMSVLYSPEERHKIEWVIGSIVSGDSKKIQKFMVLYGSAGTGKSTVLNIIQQMFDGYYAVFDAKALGSSSNAFALEAFKNNPLVAIQHDGDLSKIEDNTRLNSLVSHELMTVNEKFKSTYPARFNAFLLMGTNKPVKITDSKSGLIRRLIDCSPTGDKIPAKEYRQLMNEITFELGAIAKHCLDIYEEDHNYYDGYIPIAMMGASNDFYNFVHDAYFIFKENDGVSLKVAWDMYNAYCDEANVTYKLPRRIFQEELKNYFREYKDRISLDDGNRIRSYYSGFKTEKFDSNLKELDKARQKEKEATNETSNNSKIKMTKSKHSLLDDMLADCKAQYSNEDGVPTKKWDDVETKLSELDTTKEHYVRPPENMIVIDFDIPNSSGEKDYEKNLEEASKWPSTYTETSKSGKGIHLHYIYDGDVSKLANIYKDHVEIKKFTGKSSLRRRLALCNNEPIAHINSGLPLKEDKKVINYDGIKSEEKLIERITKCLRGDYDLNTKPTMDLIKKILDEAYESGLSYDITNMKNDIYMFAASSSHQADYCIKLVEKLKLKSEDKEVNLSLDNLPKAFFDCEVFPNLVLINWKQMDDEENKYEVKRMINPTAEEVAYLTTHYNLIGFNNLRYDNHILYAIMLGYGNKEIYNLSKGLIKGERSVGWYKSRDISYLDLYDCSSKKQSLKKFEIELGIDHVELGMDWDKEVPEDKWETVASYCDNDVISTEAVYHARKADITARKILADVAGMPINSTTNNLTTKIIFGDNKTPQNEFNYRNLGEGEGELSNFVIKDDVVYKDIGDPEYTKFDSKGRPVFPGYSFDKGKSLYRGEEVGEGGYVYAEPGMYKNVALLDIASMHPSSIIAENLFGDRYTARFKEIRDARIEIKHKNFDKAKSMLNGALAKYLDDEHIAKDLAQALKIAINAVYGQTAATYDCPFKDKRNMDNIVAKRGALFMINLKHEVQNRGYTVAHIKTDSIKVPDATPEIIQFIMDYGKMYGYNFEHEATYEKLCLVNDAVYVAKDAADGHWTATGAQFQVPYVFKTLFSHEPLDFNDFCETKSASTALYLDFNEGLGEDEHDYRFIGKVGKFTPVLKNGGLLMRENKGKYAAATGTKGYRWVESDTIKNTDINSDDLIDKSYYINLANSAIEDISKYGDWEQFRI